MNDLIPVYFLIIKDEFLFESLPNGFIVSLYECVCCHLKFEHFP